MPVLGQIEKSVTIGKYGTGSFIWIACVDCGKPRWVSVLSGRNSMRKREGYLNSFSALKNLARGDIATIMINLFTSLEESLMSIKYTVGQIKCLSSAAEEANGIYLTDASPMNNNHPLTSI